MLHINEHRVVIGDSELRNNPELIKIVMDHIEAHLNALRSTDPALLQLVGEQPLPPLQPVMPPGMTPPPGMPGPEAGGPPGVNIPQMMQAQQGNVQVGETVVGPNGQGVQLPNLPSPPAPFQMNPVKPGM